MSKRPTKAQASSARVASTFGSSTFGTASTFGASTSPLSYVSEPPDLSAISDPNVVVFFRNLSKKDSTTKAKALEDIQTYITALHQPVEEGLLEAWIKIYPRTSIDNAKAVRQSSHLVHGHIALSAGKRIAKYMPRSVAAWLSGLYDSDRSVVEATQTSIRQVFNSPEKIQNIRKAYQQPILEYCRNAIDKETTASLSDERNVSKDDAEAKYSRVISACIALLGSLLANLQSEELSKFQADYESLFGNKKLWDFVSYHDASVRRSLHRFLKTCLAKQPDAIETNLDSISRSYLSVGLNSDQKSSIYDYMETVALLTTVFPLIWTEHYKSKTSVDRRLRQFLSKGSQLGPREFWILLAQLFRVIPSETLPSSATNAIELLNSLQTGIIRRDESKHNYEAAFETYLEVASRVIQKLPEDDRNKLLDDIIVPLIAHFLRPSPEASLWSIPPEAKTILHKILQLPCIDAVLVKHWSRFTQKLVDDIKTSAPEQSNNYFESQASVVQHANRLAILQEHILQLEQFKVLQDVISEKCDFLIAEALSILQNRNGKPYGAAGAVAALVQRNSTLILAGQNMQRLEDFIQDNIEKLILTPSAKYLVDILYSLKQSVIFEKAWGAALKGVLHENDHPTRIKALEALMTSSQIPVDFDLPKINEELQNYVRSSTRDAVEGLSEWDSLNCILQSPANILSSETTDDIFTYLSQSLSMPKYALGSLQGLRQIVKSNPSLLREYLSRPQGSALLQGLLRASESPNDEVAKAAIIINDSIQTLLATGSDTKQSIYDLIHRDLREASQTSVSVETLVGLAKQSVSTVDDWEEISKVSPNIHDWNLALKPFLGAIPKSALAITNPLGGGVYLVESNDLSTDPRKISRDADGYSAAYRISQYVTRLFKNSGIFSVDTIPDEVRAIYLHNIAITIQLAADNLGLVGANCLWVEYNQDVETEAISFISDAQLFVTQQLTRLSARWSEGDAESTLLFWAVKLLSSEKPDTPSEAFYDARAYTALVSTAIGMNGWKTAYNGRLVDILSSIRKTKAVFSLLGFLNAFKEPLAASKACERMCNEIVADLTDLDITTKSEQGLRQLIILNTLLEQEDILESIAKQRIVFFVKNVIPWLQLHTVARPLKAELCRALGVLLPLMSDLYGEHWSEILNALASTWKVTKNFEEHSSWMDSPIPYVHASLKLYAQVRKLTQSEEANDDLIDAWKDTEQLIANGLINLLKHAQHFPDEFHQPLKMVNDVLARQIANISLEYLEETEELYPLLYVESQPVQQTAFGILHKKIPAAQEQISIDAALEKTTARLPEELMSLILEAPKVADLGEVNLERTVPLPLRGYLLSWLLVFDHLEHASFKVKNDYIDHVKESDNLPDLLNFTFDFLGHAHNKPADISKLDVTSYEVDVEPPKKDLQWLLTHLYFLSLRHVPSLTKSWFIGCKSRATVVTLEPWTEKYISPPVIDAALESVSTWSDQQTASEPDSPFAIKVAPRAREITASYLVDDQTMSMRISLPPAFPLASAHIESLHRVAVNETKWQSWLRTSLGAITIFNGSLIDALTTFKRNVDGAIKGQSECAICYSIVGGDRKLPDKRCQTCKNLFHGSCLFKWFKSSGGSGCPLCRNPFNYG